MNEIIKHLNSRTRKRFRLVGKNKTLITSLLKDYSVKDVISVVSAKCNEWLGDAKMEKYLRPQTLFNKSNFQSYFEQLKPVANEKLTPRQIEHREYLMTPKWQSKREAVIKRAGHHCEGCGIYLGEKGQVHHLNYDNWKDEFLFELIYLCKECHGRVHDE